MTTIVHRLLSFVAIIHPTSAIHGDVEKQVSDKSPRLTSGAIMRLAKTPYASFFMNPSDLGTHRDDLATLSYEREKEMQNLTIRRGHREMEEKDQDYSPSAAAPPKLKELQREKEILEGNATASIQAKWCALKICDVPNFFVWFPICISYCPLYHPVPHMHGVAGGTTSAYLTCSEADMSSVGQCPGMTYSHGGYECSARCSDMYGVWEHFAHVTGTGSVDCSYNVGSSDCDTTCFTGSGDFTDSGGGTATRHFAWKFASGNILQWWDSATDCSAGYAQFGPYLSGPAGCQNLGRSTATWKMGWITNFAWPTCP